MCSSTPGFGTRVLNPSARAAAMKSTVPTRLAQADLGRRGPRGGLGGSSAVGRGPGSRFGAGPGSRGGLAASLLPAPIQIPGAARARAAKVGAKAGAKPVKAKAVNKGGEGDNDDAGDAGDAPDEDELAEDDPNAAPGQPRAPRPSGSSLPRKPSAAATAALPCADCGQMGHVAGSAMCRGAYVNPDELSDLDEVLEEGAEPGAPKPDKAEADCIYRPPPTTRAERAEARSMGVPASGQRAVGPDGEPVDLVPHVAEGSDVDGLELGEDDDTADEDFDAEMGRASRRALREEREALGMVRRRGPRGSSLKETFLVSDDELEWDSGDGGGGGGLGGSQSVLEVDGVPVIPGELGVRTKRASARAALDKFKAGHGGPYIADDVDAEGANGAAGGKRAAREGSVLSGGAGRAAAGPAGLAGGDDPDASFPDIVSKARGRVRDVDDDEASSSGADSDFDEDEEDGEASDDDDEDDTDDSDDEGEEGSEQRSRKAKAMGISRRSSLSKRSLKRQRAGGKKKRLGQGGKPGSKVHKPGKRARLMRDDVARPASSF
ncbi:hypothetical protein QJQ45_027986, partial [Haematococcus lacustris]